MSNNKVDNKLIADLSKLAKLKFNAESAKKIKSDLNTIIKFVDTISEVNTDGVEALIYMSEEINVLRDDEISNEVLQQDALKNAPQKDSDYFKVPTVLRK
mgnify:CR=1 FL=1